MQELKFIDNYYQKIVNGIDNNNLKNIIGLQDKIDIYTKLYKYCTIDDTHTDKLYKKYKDLLIEYSKKISILSKNDILNKLTLFVKKYNQLVKYLYFAFNYLDKHYIKHNDLLNLNSELSDQILLNNVFIKNKNLIADYINYNIDNIRNNNYQNISILLEESNINTFLILLDKIDNKINNKNDNKINNKNLLNIINNCIISNSLEYNIKISNITYLDKNNDSITILKNLEKNYNNEFQLMNNIVISKTTIDKILENHSLISIKEKYKFLINNNNLGLINLIKLNKIDEIVYLINRVNLNDDILEYISDIIMNNFLENNNIIIEDIKRGSDLKERIKKIKLIVDNFKYFENIIDKLLNNKVFYENLFYNMEKLVNYDDNSICIITIIDYIDYKMKNKGEIKEFEFLINFIKFVNDKEYFYSLYHNKLENRLLSSNSNFDYENTFFNKILIEYSSRKSNKIKTLFKDIQKSKIFNEELFKITDSNFNIKLLTATYWKLNEDGYFKDIIMNDDIYNNNMMIAKEFHNMKFSNLRKLCINQLEGEIIINLNYNNKFVKIKTIPLVTSILTLFNDENIVFYTVEEIKEKTLIEERFINKILEILEDFNLIKHDNNKYFFNNDFNTDSELLEIGFNHLIKNNKKLSTDNLKDEFIKERIDACIVKIMKVENKLDLTTLISKTQNLLSKFSPSIENIKKSIENLIKREYLEKDSEDFYNFLNF